MAACPGLGLQSTDRGGNAGLSLAPECRAAAQRSFARPVSCADSWHQERSLSKFPSGHAQVQRRAPVCLLPTAWQRRWPAAAVAAPLPRCSLTAAAACGWRRLHQAAGQANRSATGVTPLRTAAPSGCSRCCCCTVPHERSAEVVGALCQPPGHIARTGRSSVLKQMAGSPGIRPAGPEPGPAGRWREGL